MGENGDHCVHLRGLPWSATVDDIADFLSGISISNGKDLGIHLTRNVDGRPSGEAFVELSSEEDVKQALAKNREHIGSRYIDVFKVKRSDMNWVFRQCGINQDGGAANDCVVRLRGLPFNCSKEEIANFFSGLEIVPNGITILSDYNGRTSGDAFVQFCRPESVEKALLRDKETIGHRYVEIFRSNCEELMGGLARMCWQKGGTPAGGRGLGMRGGAAGRPFGYGGMMGMRGRGGLGPYRGGYMDAGPYNGRYSERDYDGDYDRYGGGYGSYGMNYGRGPVGYGGSVGGYKGSYSGLMGRGSPRGGGKRGGGYASERFESQTGHSIHMRGLPFSATEEDIAKFFSPISLVNIVIEQNAAGRPSGSADVDFATHEDAVEGVKRDKQNINNRYIELFLRSTPSGNHDGFRSSTYGNGSTYGGSSGNYTPF